MEKFLEAATRAWNPIGEVRRHIQSGTLAVQAVVAPEIAAIIAFNLVRFAALTFVVNSVIKNLDVDAPEMATDNFVVQMGSTVGALVPVAALWLLPARMFEPHGRSATGAALLIVASANALYSAAVSAIVFFVAGAQAYGDVTSAIRIFEVGGGSALVAVAALTLFFWWRIALSVLQLRVGRFIAISVVAFMATLALAGLILLAMPSPTD